MAIPTRSSAPLSPHGFARFEVCMYVDRHRRKPPLKLRTNDPTEILPWVASYGRRVDPESVTFHFVQGWANHVLRDWESESNPGKLKAIMADFPAFLEREEAFEKKRISCDYQAMFLDFDTVEA